MFIQTQQTPNPKAIKFLLQQNLHQQDPVTISPNDLHKSELARQLFALEKVILVFIAQDFITVTIDEAQHWQHLKPQITAIIMDYLLAGMPIINEIEANTEKEFSGIEAQIEEIISNRIRPSVAMDGGDIIFKEFRDGIVYVELKGACHGCPSSTITLKQGIETMLQHYIPEIVEVVAV